MTIDKPAAAKRMLEAPGLVSCPACDGEGLQGGAEVPQGHAQQYTLCGLCDCTGLTTRAQAARYLLTSTGLVLHP